MLEAEEIREPTGCPVCGEAHPECSEALLDGMYLAALWEAKHRLSAEGKEVLDMLNHAVDVLGAVDAWESAEGIEALDPDEITVLEMYAARRTLLDDTRARLYED